MPSPHCIPKARRAGMPSFCALLWLAAVGPAAAADGSPSAALSADEFISFRSSSSAVEPTTRLLSAAGLRKFEAETSQQISAMESVAQAAVEARAAEARQALDATRKRLEAAAETIFAELVHHGRHVQAQWQHVAVASSHGRLGKCCCPREGACRWEAFAPRDFIDGSCPASTVDYADVVGAAEAADPSAARVLSAKVEKLLGQCARSAEWHSQVQLWGPGPPGMVIAPPGSAVIVQSLETNVEDSLTSASIEGSVGPLLAALAGALEGPAATVDMSVAQADVPFAESTTGTLPEAVTAPRGNLTESVTTTLPNDQSSQSTTTVAQESTGGRTSGEDAASAVSTSSATEEIMAPLVGPPAGPAEAGTRVASAETAATTTSTTVTVSASALLPAELSWVAPQVQEQDDTTSAQPTAPSVDNLQSDEDADDVEQITKDEPPLAGTSTSGTPETSPESTVPLKPEDVFLVGTFESTPKTSVPAPPSVSSTTSSDGAMMPPVAGPLSPEDVFPAGSAVPTTPHSQDAAATTTSAAGELATTTTTQLQPRSETTTTTSDLAAASTTSPAAAGTVSALLPMELFTNASLEASSVTTTMTLPMEAVVATTTSPELPASTSETEAPSTSKRAGKTRTSTTVPRVMSDAEYWAGATSTKAASTSRDVDVVTSTSALPGPADKTPSETTPGLPSKDALVKALDDLEVKLATMPDVSTTRGNVQEASGAAVSTVKDEAVEDEEDEEDDDEDEEEQRKPTRLDVDIDITPVQNSSGAVQGNVAVVKVLDPCDDPGSVPVGSPAMLQLGNNRSVQVMVTAQINRHAAAYAVRPRVTSRGQ